MKIRFGEFPEEHHFLQIMRPFADWTFKFFSWLVIISTVQFVQERTGSQVLLYVKWFSYFLILGFVGAFVDWVFSFKKYKTISGKRLAGIAIAAAAAEEGPDTRSKSRKFLSRIFLKVRSVFIAMVSLFLTIICLGAANVVTDGVISAFVDFHRQAK